MMECIQNFIAVCNDNSGLLSLIVSVIAVVVSVMAITAQNKATVFEKRLNIFCEVERVYDKSSQILKRCNSRVRMSNKRILLTTMFEYGSEEFKLIKQIVDLEDKKRALDEKETTEIDSLYALYTDKYFELWLMKDSGFSENQIRLLFSNKKAVECAIALVNVYDGIKGGLALAEEENIENGLRELGEAVKHFEDKSVLSRLRKDLPI